MSKPGKHSREEQPHARFSSILGLEYPPPMTAMPGPKPTTPRHRVESVSLPLASRKLGRRDESWLVQVVVRLRVIETHLTLFSVRNVVQLECLQMNLKPPLWRIDALFLAVEEVGPGETREMMVCCASKGVDDYVLVDQVVRQVQCVFQMAGVTQNQVLPIAVQALRPSQIHVVEFEVIERTAVTSLAALPIVSEAIYEFVPPIAGIGS